MENSATAHADSKISTFTGSSYVETPEIQSGGLDLSEIEKNNAIIDLSNQFDTNSDITMSFDINCTNMRKKCSITANILFR